MSRRTLVWLLSIAFLATGGMASQSNSESVLFQIRPVADDVRLRVTPDARPRDNYVRGWLSSRDVLDVVDVTWGYDEYGRRREWCRVIDARSQLTGWIARSVIDTVEPLPVSGASAKPSWESEFLRNCAALIGLIVRDRRVGSLCKGPDRAERTPDGRVEASARS